MSLEEKNVSRCPSVRMPFFSGFDFSVFIEFRGDDGSNLNFIVKGMLLVPLFRM